MIEQLQRANPQIKFHGAESTEFRNYGQLLGRKEATALIQKCRESIQIPQEGVIYKPSLNELESDPFMDTLRQYFGQMDIQCGVCMGRNKLMGGMEFHKSSEIHIAVTDMVMLLADMRAIDQNMRLDSQTVQAFYFENGNIIELYATTLHYCPCEIDESGFCSIVVLPIYSNTPLNDDEKVNDPLLFAKNKWLIAHEENEKLIQRGAKPGIYNCNWMIYPVQ
jgi:hypothetical protein